MYNKTFKLKSNKKKTAIWETQHRTTAKFPRIRQLNYLEPTRKITHQQSLPNQRWQFKRFQLRTTKFHRQRNLASNQNIGQVGFGASKDFEKRLVSIKKAARTKCNKCFKKGHWAKACKSQLKKKVGEVSCPEVELEGEFFLGQLTKVDMGKRPAEGL